VNIGAETAEDVRSGRLTPQQGSAVASLIRSSLAAMGSRNVHDAVAEDQVTVEGDPYSDAPPVEEPA